jgi:conjugal transfer pilus assembly protein TraB
MALQREKPTVKDKFSNWLTTLDPIKRKRLTLIGGGLVIFLLATLIITASPDDQPRAFTKPRKVEYSLFQGQNPREVSMDAMASNVKRLMTDFGNLRSTFQRQEQKINLATEELKKLSDEVKRKSEELDQKAQDIYQKLEASAHSPVNEVPLPPIGWEDAKSKSRVPKQLPTLIGEKQPRALKRLSKPLVPDLRFVWSLFQRNRRRQSLQTSPKPRHKRSRVNDRMLKRFMSLSTLSPGQKTPGRISFFRPAAS